MRDVEIELAGLLATVEQGFIAVNRRLDDQAGVQRDRHDENIERLDRIETEAKQTNGRVTRHDEQIRTLFARAERARAGALETQPVSFGALWKIVTAAGGAVAATYWVMLAAGWHR